MNSLNLWKIRWVLIAFCLLSILAITVLSKNPLIKFLGSYWLVIHLTNALVLIISWTKKKKVH